MKVSFLSCQIMGVTALGVLSLTAQSAHAAVTGNIGVFSKYVLRGVTNDAESDDPALQGGFDYTHDSGFYVGYWGSSLDYNYETNGDTTAKTGFENDFYFGYAPTIGDVTFNIGLIQYYYISVDDSDLTEALLGVSYKGAYAKMQYLLNDGVWGNSGDIYWTAGYSFPLPSDFTFAIDLGYYTYDDNDNDELGAVTLQDSGFRHANFTLSHPIGETGATMAVTYIIGGETRDEVDQGDTMVFSIKYAFDVN
ncbi:MAG TPA: TorF family putative porin [Candidatus Acidoferrales bacterium]|nr:TorF family putative porin [Candidatus Acidoferrales bacterium]